MITDQGLLGDVIWIGYTISLIILIITSFYLAKYEKLENKSIRDGFVFVGAFLGILSFFLVFLDQPRINNIFINYFFGIPLVIFGIIGRVYSALYLRTKGTTTTLDNVSSVITSGPYGWVRHPQYLTGMLSILGWFLIWGAIYCFLISPLLVLTILLQAFIEEKFILEKEFKEGYSEYQKLVAMFIPKIKHS